MSILYVNACVRENSRTDRLARYLLQKLGDFEEISLERTCPAPLHRRSLKDRIRLLEAGDLQNPLFAPAWQFAQADKIVIAAPYWDLGFPALLKNYLESIYAVGIVSRYDEKGIPRGLCRATDLYYVTTAGGSYNPAFSYEYLRALAGECFGIGRTHLICAEMLDIQRFNPEKLLQEAIARVDVQFAEGNL